MKKFLNNSGIGLVQIMMVAGAIAGVTVAGSKLLTNQKSSSTNEKTKNKIDQLHQVIQTILADKKHCSTTLYLPNNTTVGTDKSLLENVGINKSVAFSKIMSSENQLLFNTNPTGLATGTTYINNTVAIKDLTLKMGANLAANSELLVTYERYLSVSGDSNRPAVGTKQITKKIRLMIREGATPVTPPSGGSGAEYYLGTVTRTAAPTRYAYAKYFDFSPGPSGYWVIEKASTDPTETGFLIRGLNLDPNPANGCNPTTAVSHWTGLASAQGITLQTTTTGYCGTQQPPEVPMTITGMKRMTAPDGAIYWIVDPGLPNKLECFAILTDPVKDFCEQFGNNGESYLTWDSATNTCVAKNNVCNGNSFFVGFNDNGQKICKTFDGWVDFNQIVDTSEVNSCAGSSQVQLEIVAGNKVKPKCLAAPTTLGCLDISGFSSPAWNEGGCDGGRNNKRVSFNISGGSGNYTYRFKDLYGDSGWMTTSGNVTYWSPTWRSSEVTVRDLDDANKVAVFSYYSSGCTDDWDRGRALPPRCNGNKCLDLNLTVATNCTEPYSPGDYLKQFTFTSSATSPSPRNGFVHFFWDINAITDIAAFTGGSCCPQTTGGRDIRPNKNYTLKFFDSNDTNFQRYATVTANACGVPPTVVVHPCATEPQHSCLNFTWVNNQSQCNGSSFVRFNVTGGSGNYECKFGSQGEGYSACSPDPTNPGGFRYSIWEGWDTASFFVRDAAEHSKFREIYVRTKKCDGSREDIVMPLNSCRPTDLSSTAWALGTPGACVSGSATRTVKCQTVDGAVLDDSKCSGAKPSTTVSC